MLVMDAFNRLDLPRRSGQVALMEARNPAAVSGKAKRGKSFRLRGSAFFRGNLSQEGAGQLVATHALLQLKKEPKTSGQESHRE